MDSRPEGVDPRCINGAKASAVLEIVDDEGEPAALQVDLVDGSSLFCIVWSDWTLVIDHRPDVAIADYFWPPERFSAKPILTDVPETGLEVLSAVASTDEIGQVMRIDIDFDGWRVTARSFGGEIVIATSPSQAGPFGYPG